MSTADPNNAHATRGVPDRGGAGSAATAADVANEDPFEPDEHLRPDTGRSST